MEEREIWFSTDQLAYVLGVTKNHVTQLCRNGQFPNAKKKSVYWQIPLTDIDAYHQRRREQSHKLMGRNGSSCITLDDVKLAVYRAYYRADRCPPGCPGRDECLFGTCIIPDLLKGA